MIVSGVSIGLAAAGYHKGASFRRVSDAKVHFQLHVFHLRLEASHWLFGLFSIWSAGSSQHPHQERDCWLFQPRLADWCCQCLCGGAYHGLIPGEPAFLYHFCYSVPYFVTFLSVITRNPMTTQLDNKYSYRKLGKMQQVISNTRFCYCVVWWGLWVLLLQVYAQTFFAFVERHVKSMSPHHTIHKQHIYQKTWIWDLQHDNFQAVVADNICMPHNM